MNTLLICGLQVTLVAIVGGLTSLAARRWLRTSATLPLGATLAAVVLLTVCAFSSWPSWFQKPVPPVATLKTSQTVPPALVTDPNLNPYSEHLTPAPWGDVSLPPWMVSILYGTGTLENSETASNEQSAPQRWTGARWLSLFIGGAILIGLVRVIGGLWAVRHFVRTSRPLKVPGLLEQIDLLRAEMNCLPAVEVRECPHLGTAATVGWRKPVVLLSESWPTWTEAQLRSVLAHEIAHITRGDFLSTVAAQVGVVLHFYHPLVHWLANRLRLEQELAADALAATVVGGSRAYLDAIGGLALKQTEEPVGWPAHSFLPTRRTFLRRIEMLRDLKFLSGSAPRALRWGTLVCVAAVTLVAIGLRPPGGETVSAQDHPPKGPPPAVVDQRAEFLTRLAGKWDLVTREYDGRVDAGDTIKGSVVTYDQDRSTYTRADGSGFAGKIKTVTWIETNRYHVDLEHLEGPYKGQVALYLWQFEGDNSYVANASFKVRPDTLTTDPGSERMLVKFRRKPAAPPVVAVGGATQPPTAATQLEAQYVPAEASIVIAANPVVLSQQFEKLKLTKLIPAETPNPLDDANVKGCKHVTVVMILPAILKNESPDRSAGLCLTFGNAEDRNAAMQAFFPPTSGPDWVKTKLLLAEYEVHPHADQARYTPDDRTLILASQRVIQSMILAGPKSHSPLTQTESWKTAAHGSLAIAVDASAVQKVMATAPPNPFIEMFSPLWTSASSHTLSLKFADKAQLSLTSQAKDAASSQQLEGTLKAGIAMLTGMLDQAKASPDPTTKATAEGLLPVLAGHKLTTTGTLTTLKCEADLTVVAALLAPPLSQARAAAQRQQQQNNLKQIMLAMHNYHDVNGHFPPAVVIDPQSKVARSWRVELLPYLEQANLYNMYKKDEPWDSEANQKVLALMPSVYRHPSQGGSKNTAIIAAYGKGLVFEENDTMGTKISAILDGTSNTIAVVEAKTEIPWTKPEDITIDITKDKLPEFGGFAEGVFLVGVCDGSVRALPKLIDIALLKKLFTKAGGEVIEGF